MMKDEELIIFLLKLGGRNYGGKILKNGAFTANTTKRRERSSFISGASSFVYSKIVDIF